ncbi:MAG: hypothetical protein ABIH23_09680, partial [bacterium]
MSRTPETMEESEAVAVRVSLSTGAGCDGLRKGFPSGRGKFFGSFFAHSFFYGSSPESVGGNDRFWEGGLGTPSRG